MPPPGWFPDPRRPQVIAESRSWREAQPIHPPGPSDTEIPENYVTLMSTPPPSAKTFREKGADSFRAALAAVLTAALESALEAGDHARAVTLVNRGFAEGSPQLGCDLLCRAMASVGTARTWTVQLAPLAEAPR